jgi:hypothetical protein
VRKIRYKLWFWLICLADRVSPDDAFRFIGYRYRFVLGKGIVFCEDGKGPGSMIWSQDSDQGKYNGNEYWNE